MPQRRRAILGIVRTRRLFAAGVWLASTAAATAMVWAATSVVAADVTDRPAPVVAHRDVVNALSGASGNPGSSPPTSAPPASTSATTRPGPSATVRATATTAPQTTTLPVFSPVPPTTVKPTTPTTRPASPTTTQAPQVTATYSTSGGVITVACTGPNTIRLVSATPADGYFVFVVYGGPQYVALQFRSAGNAVSVGAVCLFDQPFRADYNTRPPGG